MLRLRKFMFDRVYLGPAARSEHERVLLTLTTLMDHYLDAPRADAAGPGREATTASSRSPTTWPG